MRRLNWKRIVLAAIAAELLIMYFSDIRASQKQRLEREARLHMTPAEPTAASYKG